MNRFLKKMLFVSAGCTMLFGSARAFAEADVPSLEKLVPEAKDYTLICKFNPLKFNSEGYIVDNIDTLEGKLLRVGYFVTLKDKKGNFSWAYVEMDPFTQDLSKTAVPAGPMQTTQDYVTNMVVSSNSPKVSKGKFAKGNLEFWSANYGGYNAKNIPGANNGFDFGDQIDANTSIGYGSMQIHNYLEKQTVFAFNNFRAIENCDLGIGSNTGKDKINGDSDWTFSGSGKLYSEAEVRVLGKFENLKKIQLAKVDPAKIKLFRGTTEKAFFKSGEEMVFKFELDLGNQKPTRNCWFYWVRTGDDGKRSSGSSEIVSGKPVFVKTSMTTPGFVRIQGRLTDHKGRTLSYIGKGMKTPISYTFDGGAGVDVEKLKGSPEPKDFDSFWDKQKKRLAAVPLKYKMEKMPSKPGQNFEVYAVTIDCAGPRPATGFLTMPVNAKAKSLPATVSYHGYGTYVQRAPSWSAGNRIYFNVNAHGYDLNKDHVYYDKFFKAIKSNGQIYAFDPKQNSDPEKAYFNGMALRLMRSIEFVKSLKQWDGKNLTVEGGSQGGLQAIWAAALDHDVTKCDSSITWCCDFAGPSKNKRLGGWRPNYVPALEYYDAANLAKRIPKSCFVTITRAGLGDYTCPPSGIAVLYNNMTAPKKIVYFQGSTHGFVPANPQKFVKEEKAK